MPTVKWCSCFLFYAVLLPPSVDCSLTCLSNTNMKRWSNTCYHKGRSSERDYVCKKFNEFNDETVKCMEMTNSLGGEKDEIESNDHWFYHKKLRSKCDEMGKMFLWVDQQDCLSDAMRRCVMTDSYYRLYKDLIPRKIENYHFIYSFCKLGRPFHLEPMISDECVEESTKYCWENVVLGADQMKYKTFCDLLQLSYNCHTKFLFEHNNSTCKYRPVHTLNFIRQMHRHQQDLVCSAEYINQPGLTAPVGMMRYFQKLYPQTGKFVIS